MASKTDRTPIPHIDSLDPDSVLRGSTPTITIYGSNFPDDREQTAVLVEDDKGDDGDFITPVDSASAARIEVTLTAKTTRDAGERTIKVHSLAGGGDLSNGVTLYVKPSL